MHIGVSYREIPGRKGWSTGESVSRAFDSLGHDVYTYSSIYGQHTAKWYPQPPEELDLLVYMEMNDPDPQFYELSGRAKKNVFWCFDIEMYLQQAIQFVKVMQFDEVYCANYDLFPYLGAKYLPYALDSSLLTVDLSKYQRRKVTIVGTPFQERVRFAQAVGAEIISDVYNEEYLDVIRSSKINLHHYDSGGAGILVNRVFEVMGTRNLLLTKRTPQMTKMFIDGKHCVMYDDEKECKEAINWLLRDDRARDSISKDGYEFLYEHHQYTHRARSIIDDTRMLPT